MRGLGLGAVGGEAAVRFGQRRAARGMAVDLALGRGMALARGIGLALGGAPGFARGGFGGRGRLQFGFGGFQRLPLGGGIEARLLQFVLDIDEARALGETPRRTGRGMGGRDKAVPAPDVAFQRHQPLAGLELRHQFGAAILGHDADLRQTARQLRRGLDMVGERVRRPSGNAGSPSGDAGIGPAHRRGRIDGRIEIVAEHGADRLLISLGDRDAVDDRRPQILGLAVDDLGDRAGFGFQALHALVGLGERRAREASSVCRAAACAASLVCDAASASRQIVLRRCHRDRERRDVAEAAGLLRELLLVALDAGDLLIEPRQPLAMAAHGRPRAGCAWR